MLVWFAWVIISILCAYLAPCNKYTHVMCLGFSYTHSHHLHMYTYKPHSLPHTHTLARCLLQTHTVSFSCLDTSRRSSLGSLRALPRWISHTARSRPSIASGAGLERLQQEDLSTDIQSRGQACSSGCTGPLLCLRDSAFSPRTTRPPALTQGRPVIQLA